MKKAAVIVLALLVLVIGGAFLWRYLRDRAAEKQLPGLLAALQQETRAYEQVRWFRPPVEGDAVAGRAWDHYREAVRLKEKADEEVAETEGIFSLEAEPWLELTDDRLALRPEYEALAEYYRPAVEALVRGAHCAEAGSQLLFDQPLDEDAVTSFDLSWEMDEHVRGRALLELQAGREDEALALLIALFRVAEDCYRGARWVDMGGGLSIERKTGDFLAAAIARGRISEEGVKRVEEALIEAPVEPKISRKLLTAGWIAEQWDYHRAATGEEELMEGAQELFGPLSLLMPTGRANVALGWAWLRRFEADMAATVPVNTGADLTRIEGLLQTRGGDAGFVTQFYAANHSSIYHMLPKFYGLRADYRTLLAINVALRRRRDQGVPDPAEPAKLLPAGRTTSNPPTWWSHPDAKLSWIGLGEQHPEIEMPPVVEKMIEQALEGD